MYREAKHCNVCRCIVWVRFTWVLIMGCVFYAMCHVPQKLIPSEGRDVLLLLWRKRSPKHHEDKSASKE